MAASFDRGETFTGLFRDRNALRTLEPQIIRMTAQTVCVRSKEYV
jgi:hypothetical protein